MGISSTHCAFCGVTTVGPCSTLYATRSLIGSCQHLKTFEQANEQQDAREARRWTPEPQEDRPTVAIPPYGFRVAAPRNVKAEVIAEASKIIDGARREAYGPPEDNFGRILTFWNAWLKCTGREPNLTLADVPILFDLMKTARLAESPTHRDSIVDKIGYTACYAEIVLGPEEAST